MLKTADTISPLALHTAQRKLALLGTGSHVPGNGVSSSALDHKLGKPDGWCFQKSGVASRYMAVSETATHMAAEASRRALANAQLKISDIDCVIAASATMDQAMPYNGALLHQALGFTNPVPAFDVGMSCLSFLTALDLASYLIQAGRFRRILIASSDIATAGVNWDHAESSLIFGDGAAATIVGDAATGAASTLLASRIETLSQGTTYCQIRAGGSRYHPLKVREEIFKHAYFEMNGKAVFRLVAEHMPGFLERLTNEAGVALEDIDVVIPHQASALGLEHWSKRIGIRKDRLVNIFSRYGNQVSASLPTTLHEAHQQGRLRVGSTVLLVGTSAGVSMGGMVIRYGC